MPLDGTKNEIRLLRILPNPTMNEGIQCSLSIASLDDNPRYQALSYAWDDRATPQEIFLDGQPFPVTKNLEDALWCLQSRSRSKVFWIDAICINQNDNLERNHQVGRMRTIYKQAKDVVVWLGRSTHSTKISFSLFEALCKRRYSKQRFARRLRNIKYVTL
jgi:hypothetical protein